MKSTTLWQIMAFHIIHLSNWIGSTYAQSFKQSKCVDRYIWALSNHFAMASNAETFRFHCCWQCIEQTIDLPVITKASTTYAVTAIQFTTTQSFTDWLIKTHTHTHTSLHIPQHLTHISLAIAMVDTPVTAEMLLYQLNLFERDDN